MRIRRGQVAKGRGQVAKGRAVVANGRGQGAVRG